jgi:hypothetical protein
LASASGLELDDTYTAKTLAALSALRAERKDRVVVFWNTYDGRGITPETGDITQLPPELRAYAQ